MTTELSFAQRVRNVSKEYRSELHTLLAEDGIVVLNNTSYSGVLKGKWNAKVGKYEEDGKKVKSVVLCFPSLPSGLVENFDLQRKVVYMNPAEMGSDCEMFENNEANNLGVISVIVSSKITTEEILLWKKRVEAFLLKIADYDTFVNSQEKQREIYLTSL